MSEETKSVELGEDFRKVLNRHGYPFQYAVIKLACDLRRERRSEWDYLQSEFPVIVNGKSTRVDFVLRKPSPHVYLIAECKRVNPAYSDWCFARSQYARGDSASDKVIFQYVWEPPDLPNVVRLGKGFETGVFSTSSDHVYHVGRAVKSKNKGDANGRASDEIEDAAGQVCKGLNGLVEHFYKQEEMPMGRRYIFCPLSSRPRESGRQA